MTHILTAFDLFQLRILHDEAALEHLMDGYVDIAVDRSRKDEASVLAIVRRQISAAAAE